MSSSSPYIEKPSAAPRKRTAREALLWAVTLALFWALINPGDHKSWLVGLPVVMLGTSAALLPLMGTSFAVKCWEGALLVAGYGGCVSMRWPR